MRYESVSGVSCHVRETDVGPVLSAASPAGVAGGLPPPAGVTAKCQSWPPLLSHVPLPFSGAEVKTTSSTVVPGHAGMVWVHLPSASVIAGRGVMRFCQPLRPACR